MKFHEDHIINKDSMEIIIIVQGCVYMRAIFKTEPIVLISMPDFYIPIITFCTKFYKVDRYYKQ